LVDIVYDSHVEITSIVGISSFPSTPRDHPTLFTQVRGKKEKFSEVRGSNLRAPTT
jgi:hypothetical protein